MPSGPNELHHAGQLFTYALLPSQNQIAGDGAAQALVELIICYEPPLIHRGESGEDRT